MFSALLLSCKRLWSLLQAKQKASILIALVLSIISATLELISVAAIGKLFLAAEGEKVFPNTTFFGLNTLSLANCIIIFTIIIAFNQACVVVGAMRLVQIGVNSVSNICHYSSVG